MWRREEKREMIAWLYVSTKLDMDTYVVVGPNSKCCEKELER